MILQLKTKKEVLDQWDGSFRDPATKINITDGMQRDLGKAIEVELDPDRPGVYRQRVSTNIMTRGYWMWPESAFTEIPIEKHNICGCIWKKHPLYCTCK